jgi:hypothetical protein
LLVRKFDGDVKLPRAVARRENGTLQNVDESLVFGHPLSKATSVPTSWNTEHAETTNTHHTDGRLFDLSGG